jgi:alanyl-tRNA synthetase
VPGFSKELCGGTHVGRTGDIGLCKIVSEGSISAGVRRIEAISGHAAVRQYQHLHDSMQRIAQMVRASEPEVVDHVEKLLGQQRILEKQIDQLKSKVAQSVAGEVEGKARMINNVRVVATAVPGMDRQQMRALADSLRNRWKTAVVVLASTEDSNVAIVSAVTKDLTDRVHAGKLAGSVAQALGGKGGGRPDMAEAGGKDAGALPAALENVYRAVQSML